MRFYQKYLDKGLPPVEAAYATLIEGMDKVWETSWTIWTRTT